uniref:Uncharacterized protein n=1 Tax=Anguilla anguilla TaxID=7936 RepID=A0A0E9W743_ANGAN
MTCNLQNIFKNLRSDVHSLCKYVTLACRLCLNRSSTASKKVPQCPYA